MEAVLNTFNEIPFQPSYNHSFLSFRLLNGRCFYTLWHFWYIKFVNWIEASLVVRAIVRNYENKTFRKSLTTKTYSKASLISATIAEKSV